LAVLAIIILSDRLSALEIINTGHDPATVKRVVQLVTRAEFKRRQAPPGLKISDRAFGSGWRMPIASGQTQVLNLNSP
jgi:NAD+ synthase (glutamine-hydrolysing)